jgi:hypothetical protein
VDVRVKRIWNRWNRTKVSLKVTFLISDAEFTFSPTTVQLQLYLHRLR